MFTFRFLQVLYSLKPFSLINVKALVSSFFESKFSAKFNLELIKNLCLKILPEKLNLNFLYPLTLAKSQIELQNFLGFFKVHFNNFEYFFDIL